MARKRRWERGTGEKGGNWGGSSGRGKRSLFLVIVCISFFRLGQQGTELPEAEEEAEEAEEAEEETRPIHLKCQSVSYIN